MTKRTDPAGMSTLPKSPTGITGLDEITGLAEITGGGLTDDIIRLRCVEIDGQLRKTPVVVETRGGNHSKDIREYAVTEKGVVLIKPQCTYYALSGLPERVGPVPPGLPPEPKAKVSR